jgi:hypothetical protein
VDTLRATPPVLADEAELVATLNVLAEIAAEHPALTEVIREIIAQLAIVNPEIVPLPPSPPQPPVVLLPSSTPVPDPVSPCSDTISGTGVAGSLITLTFADGHVVTATVDAAGTFTALISPDIVVVPGEVVTIVQTSPGYLPSEPVTLSLYEDAGRMITGIVSPTVYDDLGYGNDFMRRFVITVQLRDPVTCAPLFTTTVTPIGTTGTGRFCFANVPEGDYTLYILRWGFLARTLAVHADAEGGLTRVSPPDDAVFNLIAGDANNSNWIDGLDRSVLFTALESQYMVDSNYTAVVDFNADGFVNQWDRDLFFENFDKSSSQYPGYAGCSRA